MSSCFAILGWSLPAIESAQKLGKPYVVVSFSDFEDYAKKHDIPFVSWDFRVWNETNHSLQLVEALRPHGVTVAVPLFEETVEWAGAVNSILRNDPRIYNRASLFRNKAVMKRKALLAGLRVGLFEEVYNRDQIRKFLDRLNEAELALPGEEDAWMHLKPFAAMGTVGHKLLRGRGDIDAKVVEADFPSLVESHLPGKEFSCEVLVHGGEIRFMNITEYIDLGHTNFVPPGAELEAKRPVIEQAVRKLVKGFGVQNGLLHPEWFLTEDDELSFGEVAYRIPGGHIFELIEEAYGFDPIAGLLLCSDPETTPEELERLLPGPQDKPSQVAGCVMVYPKPGEITRMEIPEELEEDPYFWKHTLHPPTPHKVSSEREGFGNHYGTVYFRGPDPERVRELLVHYDNVDFFA